MTAKSQPLFSFGEGLANTLRNIVGSTIVLLGAMVGVALSVWAFHPTGSLLGVYTMALGINLFFYADLYHSSIVRGMSLRRFCLSLVALSILLGFLMGLGQKLLPI